MPINLAPSGTVSAAVPANIAPAPVAAGASKGLHTTTQAAGESGGSLEGFRDQGNMVITLLGTGEQKENKEGTQEQNLCLQYFKEQGTTKSKKGQEQFVGNKGTLTPLHASPHEQKLCLQYFKEQGTTNSKKEQEQGNTRNILLGTREC